MAEHASLLEHERLVVHTRPAIDLDEEEFFRFCQINRDLQIERTAEGDIIIMAPEAGSSAFGSTSLLLEFGPWAKKDGTGRVVGPSAGFNLPNGATRSPDVAWVRKEKLAALTDEQWHKFLPLCPDFVLELRSPSDVMRRLEKKMEEYCENGAELGWLLDPVRKRVLVYRPGVPVEILENPKTICGDPVLRGFVLHLEPIWAEIERKDQSK